MKHLKIFIFIFSSFFISACTQSGSMPGYIEGEYTYIATGASGALCRLAVQRGQTVKQGDLLYTLDPEPEKSNVLATTANIADLKSQLAFSKLQFERQKNLFAKSATPKVNFDQAQTDLTTKAEQLTGTQAQLVHAQWSLQQKTAYAPVTGVVFDTFYRPGEWVQANYPVLALLAPENIKVLFYIPENILSKIKLGQTIHFTCDSCKGKTEVKISYISPEAEYTPPVIYSKDTRYKLVYLIRADLPKAIAQNFHPGQPIEVFLNA